MPEIRHVDLFAGTGGICTGFHAAGIKTLLAIEKVESCVETYKANHKTVPVIRKDIRKVTAKEIKQLVKLPIHVVSAGMPCETFSTAGSTSRSSYDHRQFLFMEAVRIAKIVKAKLILFENVPAIKTKTTQKGGGSLIVDKIYDELSAQGYKYCIETILNASNFGVPQYRERFFILATNDKRLQSKLKVPVSCHNGKISVNQAFAGLPPVNPNTDDDIESYLNRESDYSTLMKDNVFWRSEDELKRLTYHIAPNHRQGTLERFLLIKPGEGLKDLFDKLDRRTIVRLQEKKVLPKKWYIQRNRRLIGECPSVTVTSHCLDELVHPDENRALTVREVARLQSFPDVYDFKGGPLICPHMYETQDKYEQVGDAVPPLLAYAWGKVINEIFLKSNGL